METKKEAVCVRVKHTAKAKVSLTMSQELYSKVTEAAANENRNLSNWMVQAAMEKLQAIG